MSEEALLLFMFLVVFFCVPGGFKGFRSAAVVVNIFPPLFTLQPCIYQNLPAFILHIPACTWLCLYLAVFSSRCSDGRGACAGGKQKTGESVSVRKSFHALFNLIARQEKKTFTAARWSTNKNCQRHNGPNSGGTRNRGNNNKPRNWSK